MTTAPATNITVRTSSSTRPVLDMLLPEFEQATGHKVTLILDTARNSLARIKAGERADAAVLLDYFARTDNAAKFTAAGLGQLHT